MNSWFPRHAHEALFGAAAALAALGAAGCSPNNSVKAGPPVLTEMIILQAGASGPTPTTILPTTPDCTPVSGTVDGTACNPVADADAGTTADTLCRAAATNDWCTCNADPMDATVGTWGCPPFIATAGVIAIFDRLLKTAPFDAVDGGATPDVATLAVGAGTPTTATLLTDYSATGSTTGLIFQLFKGLNGNYRVDGPSLFMAANPAFPSGATMTISLDPTMVTSKAGEPFVGSGLLLDGMLSFNTAPFTASIATPPPAGDASADAAPDMTPATITFSNFVAATDVMSHITVTAGGTAVPVKIDSADNLNVTITPETTWPASATITITVDQSTKDVNGEMLSTPVAPATFTTSAS